MPSPTDDEVTKPGLPIKAIEERRRARRSSEAVEVGIVLGLLDLREADAGKLHGGREEAVRRIIRRALDDGVSLERERTLALRQEVADLRSRVRAAEDAVLWAEEPEES